MSDETVGACTGAPDPGEAGLVEPLGAVLTQLSKGGGAKGINIDDVTRQLEDLTREYPFQIPSYFALILRAFSVIEGIALRVDPGYSIVQECFPYIARRLLRDNHPRTRAALRQLLYAVRAHLFNSQSDQSIYAYSPSAHLSFVVEGACSRSSQPGVSLRHVLWNYYTRCAFAACNVEFIYVIRMH